MSLDIPLGHKLLRTVGTHLEPFDALRGSLEGSLVIPLTSDQGRFGDDPLIWIWVAKNSITLGVGKETCNRDSTAQRFAADFTPCQP